jgi:hypothetical protein
MSLRSPLFGTMLLGLVYCGLTLSNATSNGDGDGGSVPPQQVIDAETAAPMDGGVVADVMQDSLPEDDAAVLSALNVKRSYAIAGGLVYEFTVGTTPTFAEQISIGCPSPAEETAVLADGRIFVTSSGNKALYSFIKGAGCTPIREADNGAYPSALGVAPVGTVSLTQETLVGYRGAAYVRVDTVTGSLARSTAPHLAT